MKSTEAVLKQAAELRWQLPQNLHDRIAESIHGEAARIAGRSVTRSGSNRRLAWQQRLDHLLTNAWTAFPIMVAVLGAILWITIVGANAPSSMLATLLVEQGHALLTEWFVAAGSPAWFKGLVVDGMYLAAVWRALT